MRLALAIACALAGQLIGERAFAQAPESVAQVELVVTVVPAPARWGAKPLAEALREKLESQLGNLLPTKALNQARKDLGIAKSDYFWRVPMAQAGREAGADYVLKVEVRKQGRSYIARALLVDVQKEKIMMKVRSKFKRPKREAKRKGVELAEKVLGKLEELIDQAPNNPPAPIKPTEPDEEDPEPLDSDPPDLEASDPGQDTRTASEDPIVSDPDPTGPTNPPDPPEPPDSPDTPGTAFGLGAKTGGSKVQIKDEVEVERPESSEPNESNESNESKDQGPFLWATLTAGSAVYNSYSVSTESLNSSLLSYRLAPYGQGALGVEGYIPGIGLGGLINVQLSTIVFQISDAANQEADPGAILIDFSGAAAYAIDLFGEGASTYRLIPALGVRVVSMSVDEHDAQLVVSSTALSPTLSVLLRAPILESIDLGLRLDFGYLVAYSESPGVTGEDYKGGLQFGAALQARFWPWSLLGFAFDARFDLSQISFGGEGSRNAPPGESLSDAKLSTRALELGLGVALRL